MKIIDLLKSHKIYPVYAAVVFYTLTFSLAAVIAPHTAHAATGLQSIHQLVKTETNDHTFVNNDYLAHSEVIRTIRKDGFNISHLVGNNDPS